MWSEVTNLPLLDYIHGIWGVGSRMWKFRHLGVYVQYSIESTDLEMWDRDTEQACRYMHIHTKENRELWKTITSNKKQKKKEKLIENTKESDQEDGWIRGL